MSFTVTGLDYDAAAGRFSWTGAPDNGALPAGFACAVAGSTATAAESSTTCTLPAPLPATGAVVLTVTVDGHSFDHTRPIPTKAITP